MTIDDNLHARRRPVLRTVFVVFLFATSAAAHHKLATFYDLSRPVALKGALAKVEWTNPHAFLYVDVATPTGQTEHRMVEGDAISALTRRGWMPDTAKVGDSVTVSGFLPTTRNDLKYVGGASIEWRDGRSLFFGEDLKR